MAYHYGVFEGTEIVGCGATMQEAYEIALEWCEGAYQIVYDPEDDFLDWMD